MGDQVWRPGSCPFVDGGPGSPLPRRLGRPTSCGTRNTKSRACSDRSDSCRQTPARTCWGIQYALVRTRQLVLAAVLVRAPKLPRRASGGVRVTALGRRLQLYL